MQIGRRGVDIFRPHPSDAAPPPVRRDCSAIFRSRRADAHGGVGTAAPSSPAPRDGEVGEDGEDVVVSSLPVPTPPVWPPAEIAGCLSDSTSASGQARRTSRGRRARILGRGRSLRSASGSGSVSPGKKGPRRPSYYRIELDGESERARLEYLEDSSVTVPPGGDRSDLLRVATPRRRGDGTAAQTGGLSRAGPVSSRSASGGEQGQRAGEGSGEAPPGPGHVWTVSGTGKIVALPVREEDREAGADAAAAVSKSAVPSAVPSRAPTKGGAPGPPPSSPVPLLCKASMSDDDSHGSDDGSLTFSDDGKGRSSTPPCAGATPPACSASSSGGDEYDIVSPPRLGRSAGLLAFHPGSASAYPAAGGGAEHDGGMRTAIEGEIRDRIAGKQGGAGISSSGSARSSGTSPSSAHSDRGGCEGGMIAAILEMLSWNACCRYGGQDGPGGDGMAGVCQS